MTYYPYPVNDKSSARRAALQPHIYSPPEQHTSPRDTMYPHFHPSGSPSPHYIYSGYEQYYSKDSWVVATPSAWPTSHPLPPRSSSLPEATVNPKVTLLTPQPVLMSDIDTPSSISSHSVLTPSSPFAQCDVGEVEFQPMDLDEFDDDDDEEDFIDSDFADEMEGTDEANLGPSPIYGATALHVVKSTSALEGALGDTPSSLHGTNLGVITPADRRRLSASVPGYPNTSHRSTGTTQRWTEKGCEPTPATSSPSPETPYPSQHMYTQRNYSSSTSLFAPASLSLYNHASSSSLAGAFSSFAHVSRPTSQPLPILQPQPIRPIPPIPLADLTASANEGCLPESPQPQRLRALSPLPLLCQPVSDAVRYQLKEPPASGAIDDACYVDQNASESMSQDLITRSGNDRFAQRGLTLFPEHPSDGTCVVGNRLYSSGCMDLPMRW